MIYKVRKTSLYNDDTAPYEWAIKRFFPYWHTRTCTEEYFNKNFSTREGLWRDNWNNHSITDKWYITRQEDDREYWSIEINTLEELEKFVKQNWEIVFNWEEIEIYDDYRE